MKTIKPKKLTLSQELANYKYSHESINRKYEQCSKQLAQLQTSFSSALQGQGSAYASMVSGYNRDELTWDQIFIRLGRLLESRDRFNSTGDLEHRMLCRLNELEKKFAIEPKDNFLKKALEGDK